MAVNTSPQFRADIEQYLDEEVLPLARRQLVAYRFGEPATLPEGRGTVYTATRWNRVPLPAAPLNEGVPPVGETLTIQQVTCQLLQWGDKITITDVAELTIKHPVVQQAKRLLSLQIAETLDRNTFNALNGGTQVNYVNERGARASILVGDVLDTTTVNRTSANLVTYGSPRFLGDEETDAEIDAMAGGSRASENPRTHPHYVALIHPLVRNDFMQNPTVVTAWSYSDLNRLYNAEIGEWGQIIFCESNMIPFWQGQANTGINPTGSTTGGALANGTYVVQVTGSDTQNQYESQIYQQNTSISVGGSGAGSITLTMPSTAGSTNFVPASSPTFTYSVYISQPGGTTTNNLALSPQGPTVGPLAGMATQLAPGATITLTGIGLAQTPPAAPATGVTVFPTYVFGRGAYAQVKLKDVEWTALFDADKSDPLNQQRMVGWKCFYGTCLTNVSFMGRIESSASAASQTSLWQ